MPTRTDATPDETRRQCGLYSTHSYSVQKRRGRVQFALSLVGCGVGLPVRRTGTDGSQTHVRHASRTHRSNADVPRTLCQVGRLEGQDAARGVPAAELVAKDTLAQFVPGTGRWMPREPYPRVRTVFLAHLLGRVRLCTSRRVHSERERQHESRVVAHLTAGNASQALLTSATQGDDDTPKLLRAPAHDPTAADDTPRVGRHGPDCRKPTKFLSIDIVLRSPTAQIYRPLFKSFRQPVDLYWSISVFIPLSGDKLK